MKDDLAQVSDRLSAEIPDARWVPRDNLHVTLAFLGWVADERVAEVSDGVSRATGEMIDFTTHLEGLGAFPSERRARVIWAGLADPAGGVAGLALAIAEALRPLGFEPEQRAFHPHVTLARLRVPRPVTLPAVDLRAHRVPVDRVTLFRSHLRRPAPRYEPLATFSLRWGSDG